MSKKFEVSAELRADVGKGASRRLRRAGRVPAVVYGADKDPVSLTVDHNYLMHAVLDEAFHASVLDLVLPNGQRDQVVLRDVQRHPFKPLLTHVDFLRVAAGHLLRIEVPIHFINEDKSPAARKAGVVISHQITQVEVSSTPENLPEYLEVDLAKLEAGDSVLLSQIVLPAGVSIPALEAAGEHDAPVVTAIFVRAGQGGGETGAESEDGAQG